MFSTARPNLLAGEDLPGDPRQKRSVEKRSRLKSAALALFGEKGYEATSIQEIAARAEVAVGGFYQHFRSKRQLLLVLMDELLGRLSRLEEADLEEGVRGWVARALAADLEFLGAWRAWQEAALSDPGLARKHGQIREYTTGRVIAAFTRFQQLPGARPGVDVVGLARAMDGLFWNFLAGAGQLPEAEWKRWIDVATHLLYHALFLDARAR